MSLVRVRFAPSPTGTLHLGGARTALINLLFARHEGGLFVLRIEDTDEVRNIEGAEAALERDLDWLGLVPDESPRRGGPFGPYRQSERRANHLDAFERLRVAERIYPCFCPPDGKAIVDCPERCFHLAPEQRAAKLALGLAHAFRFRLDHSARVVDDMLHGRVDYYGAPAPDPVLLRPGGEATFLFANAVDDLDQQISHVIRGDDHLANAWKQAQLFRALGAEPPRFAHLPLIHGPDHAPLSKRHGAASVGAVRELGYPAEAVIAALAHLGMNPPEWKGEGNLLDLLAAKFQLERLSAAPAVHDPARLDHLSNLFLRSLSAPELCRRAREIAEREKLIAGDDPAWWGSLLAFMVESAPNLGAAVGAAGNWIKESESQERLEEQYRDVLEAWLAGWPAAGIDETRFKALGKELGTKTGKPGRELYHPLRVAITGRGEGPALARLAPIIDQAAAEGGAAFEVHSCRDRIARSLDAIRS